VRFSAENSFPYCGPPKNLLTNPEGSSAYRLYGDDDANTLEISIGSFGSRNAPNHLLPACFFPWPYETTPEALARNVEGLKKFGGLYAPILAVAKSYAEMNGLQIDWNDPTATVSKLAVITQTPKEFDFPISDWPPQFHYAGPFHDDEGREQVPFPWEKLTGAPLIYGSLGTLLNGIASSLPKILLRSACPVGKKIRTATRCRPCEFPETTARPLLRRRIWR